MPSDDKPTKPRAKRARPKRAKPSFAATPPADGAQAGWAYRSDAPEPQPAETPAAVALPAAPEAAALPAAAPEPAALPAAPAPRAALPASPKLAPAPIASEGGPPHRAGASGLVTSALDALAVPIGIVLMAALAPVSALLAPRRKS